MHKYGIEALACLSNKLKGDIQTVSTDYVVCAEKAYHKKRLTMMNV